MEKNLFNLKFASKELERNSKKCDKVSLPYYPYISTLNHFKYTGFNLKSASKELERNSKVPTVFFI